MPITEPTSILEISSANPGDVPVWVDVSSSFRSAKVKRGKQRQQDRSVAGTATFLVSNADRKFDPENAAGPLYAFLKPMRRIRLRALWNGVYYSVFDGYIDFIEQNYNPPREATATIAVTDGFKRLESAYLPGVYESTLAPETFVKAWYRFDEPLSDPNNAITVEALSDHSGHGYTAYKVYDVTSVEGLIEDDPNTALRSPSTALSGIALPESLTPLALPWALEFWLKAPRYDAGAGGANTYSDIVRPFNGPASSQGNPGTLDCYTRNAFDGVNVDKLACAIGNSVTPEAFIRSSVPVFDNKRHHIVIVAEAGLALKIYVDGVNVSEGAIGTSKALVRQAISLGVALSETTWDEVRVYQGLIPSQATVTAHYNAGINPWGNDTPAARMTRIADLIGWPVADRSFSANGSPLQRTGLGGTALDHFLLIEETELGAVFMTSAGVLTFLGRNDLITSPRTVSQTTFGDGAGENGYTKLDGYRLADSNIRNVIRRQREGGAEVVAQDDASIAAYGQKMEGVAGTQEVSDAVAFDRANYRLAHSKDPKAVVTGLELEPRKDPDVMFPIVLGTMGLYTRITVRRRPQNVGALIEQEGFIVGIEHSIAPKKWTSKYHIDVAAAQKYFLFDVTPWGSTDWRFSA